MELGHLLQLLTSPDSILTGGVGALIALFFFLRWLVTRHVVKLEEDITKLKRTNEDLAHQVKLAESSRIQAVEERDRVKQDLARAREEAKKAIETANQSEQALEELNMLWQKYEETIKQLTEELEAAKEREIELHDNRTRLEDKWRKAQRLATRNRKRARELENQINGVIQQDGRVWLRKPVNAPPFVPLAERKGPVIISVLNLKGGVGKTTLTANLGGYLACHQSEWVLLLDLDHQRSLTQALLTTDKRKAAADADRTIQAVLRLEVSRSVEQVCEQVEGERFNRLWIVGNSDVAEENGNRQNLDDLEMDLLRTWFMQPENRDIRYILRKAIHSSRVLQERYSYVLIDCPPRLTTACINALAASDLILIPTQPEPVSAKSVPHLLRRLRPLRKAGVLPDLRVLIVGNMVSKDANKKKLETKQLQKITATANQLWGVSPVRLAESLIYHSDYYGKYSRDFEEKKNLQLPAVAVAAIRDEYASLVKEIEAIANNLKQQSENCVHESPNPAAISQ